MRIGTRRSALALAQANLIAALLQEGQPGSYEIVPMLTRGDSEGEQAAGETDKSRWVGEIDLAVHSAKDVPGELADGLALLGAPARASAQDVLCGVDALENLPKGAR